jgi:hypothetical protein
MRILRAFQGVIPGGYRVFINDYRKLCTQCRFGIQRFGLLRYFNVLDNFSSFRFSPDISLKITREGRRRGSKYRGKIPLTAELKCFSAREWFHPPWLALKQAWLIFSQ